MSVIAITAALSTGLTGLVAGELIAIRSGSAYLSDFGGVLPSLFFQQVPEDPEGNEFCLA
jgi:hypothetical protein